MNSEPVELKDLLQRLIGRWPWLLAAACLGGLLGLVASCLFPPVYEAVAVVGVGVDYGRTLPLDDEALRHAFNRAREVFLADETLEAIGSAEGKTRARQRRRTSCAARCGCRRSEVAGSSAFEPSPRRPPPGRRTPGPRLPSMRCRPPWDMPGVRQIFSRSGSSPVASCQPAATPALPAAWACAAAPEAYDPEQALTEIEQEAVLSGILPSMSFSMLQEAEPPGKPRPDRARDERPGRAAGWRRRRSDRRTRVAV